MKDLLKDAGLLSGEDDNSEISISFAWSVMSRLGCPGRYGGRSVDGEYEYLITHPVTGDFLATGKGATLEWSMCDAALKARPLLNPS